MNAISRHEIDLLGASRFLALHAEQALDDAEQTLASRDVDEASANLGRFYNSNRLRLVGRRQDFRMNLQGARVGRLGLATLAFGAEVEIEQAGDRPFVLVTTQIHGFSRVTTPEAAAEGGGGFVVVDSAGQSVSKRFSADSKRCNVRIEQEVIEARCAALLQRPLDRPLRFAPFGGCDAIVRRRWLALLQLLLGYVQGSRGDLPDAIVHQLEESVLLHLLLEHRHSFSEALRHGAASLAPRHVKRAEDFLRANAGEELTLDIVAQAVGCSVRSLNEGFRMARGTTPMNFLRQVRLEGVRADLLAGAAGGIAEIALRWGFGHLGRFSGDYRRQFGELPSETLRRQK